VLSKRQKTSQRYEKQNMKNKTTTGVSARNLLCWTSGQTKCPKRLAYLKALALALAFLGIYFYAVPLPAQTTPTPSPAPPRVSATITFANGASITVRSNSQEKFRLVGILPGETVNIQLQLPPRFVNTPVAVQALDGGIVPVHVPIATNGTAALAFHAGVQPGLYRILLTAQGRSTLLQFLVPNP
jgi:hypothetical protein